MNSNRIVTVDRELASGSIEGVYFGPKIWIIARSPSAVLVWIFGHSASINGHQSYYEPHLTLLPDRSPTFIYNPRYKSFPSFGRIHRDRVHLYSKEICDAFGADALESILQAVEKRQTAIIEGGGGSLLPFQCWGDAWKEWRAAGGGFIVRPEGITEHDTMRHKLGWKPKPAA
jgi:hypothetical protein